MTTPQESKRTPIFIGRWTPKILFFLKQRPHRHGELRRNLGSVSQRMLTRTLRDLESTGLVARNVTASKGIAVKYSLTQLGKSIISCWAKRYGRLVSADMHFPQAYRTEWAIEELHGRLLNKGN